MPKTKNQAKNKSRFEVRGGVINEFEFALNEGAMTEEEHQGATKKGSVKKGAAQKSAARKGAAGAGRKPGRAR
jgi:hypothetical protein